MVWRLLADGEHSAGWNMAVDQALLDAVETGVAPPTLRIYAWEEPAVTVGRFQDAGRDLDWEFCRSKCITVVRRPTGGRGILHGGDVTVSVAAPLSALNVETPSIIETYKLLSAGFVAAFDELGYPLTQGDCRRQSLRSGDCFLSRTAADLLGESGEKLIGSAMRRTGSAVLLQASVRYRQSGIQPRAVFRGESSAEGYPLEHMEEADIRNALVRGFQSALDARLVPGDLTGWEEERAAALVKGLLIAENRVEDSSNSAPVGPAVSGPG